MVAPGQVQPQGGESFWGLTLVLMLGLIWFDASRTLEQRAFLHVAVYAASALLWLAIVPAWLMQAGRSSGPC